VKEREKKEKKRLPFNFNFTLTNSSGEDEGRGGKIPVYSVQNTFETNEERKDHAMPWTERLKRKNMRREGTKREEEKETKIMILNEKQPKLSFGGQRN
jgi:hypothetical protein